MTKDEIPLIIRPRQDSAASGSQPAAIETDEFSSDVPPLVLSPSGNVRLIEEASPAAPALSPSGGRVRSFTSVIWILLLMAAIVLMSLWLAREVVIWANALAGFHPILGVVLYSTVASLLLFGTVLAWSQCRAYMSLAHLGNLRARFEQARCLQVSKVEDEKLRKEFTERVDKLAETRLITAEVRQFVLESMHDRPAPGAWVDRASSWLLRDLDGRVKHLIETEARVVGVTTALSPSGPLDAVLIVWRNGNLILRIADIYGVRPGGYGNYRLFRRVVTNMVLAALSQEAMQMLYAAYGPAAVQAATQGFRGVVGAISTAGSTFAPDPVTKSIFVAGGALGKGAADMVGEAAGQITGPLLQGVLNAILTIRIGLAAQTECRLVALSSDERRMQSAGIVSALLGFFASVRQNSSQSTVSAGDTPKV